MFNRSDMALAAGAGLAAALGILLGGSMKPDLDLDGRPAGPQMLAGWSGVRSTGPFDPGSTNPAYAGPPPAYVTGTDYVQAAYAQPPAEAPRRVAREAAPQAEPSVITQAAYEEPPAEPVVYPSVSGGAPRGEEAPTPPEEPEAVAITG